MSKFEIRPTECYFEQSKIIERGAVCEVCCLRAAGFKMALSFLTLFTFLFFAGQAGAVGSAGIVMADVSSSMENWQGRAFSAIDLQKRLDNLARDKQKQIIRNRKVQRATKQRKKIIEVRQKQALARERQINKIRLRRSIQLAAKRRARNQARYKRRVHEARSKRRTHEARSKNSAQIIYEPVKIQRCLKRAGYFNGVVTGRLDDATLLAFLAFRDDKNLQSRPNDLYDVKSQKVLFSLCPERNLNSLTQIIASSLLGKKPVVVTAVRKPITDSVAVEIAELDSRRTSIALQHKRIDRDDTETTIVKSAHRQFGQRQIVQRQVRSVKKLSRFPSVTEYAQDKNTDSDDFAVDVLAATDKSEDRLYSSGKHDRLPSPVMAQSSAVAESATSSFAMRRTVSARPVEPLRQVKLASLPEKTPSLFSRKLSIGDLAMAGPSNPNTCSPQTHKPALAMSTAPMSSPPPMQMARASDEAPLTTGAISPSGLRTALRSTVTRNNRLVPTPEKQKACLPQDLYDLISSAHGSKKDLAVCKKDCLPAPAAFSSGQKKLFAEQYKINWCGTGCLGLADPLPLRDVMQIEREARVHVCMTPQTQIGQVPSRGLDRQGINAQIRALYEKLPGGYGNDDNIAVLIGNKNYARKEAQFGPAHLNIAAMKALLLEQLGYKRENIIVVKDAKRADFVRLFGKRGNANGELKRRLSEDPNAQLMIYYSGHASSSGLGLNNYLLPVDAIRGVESKTSYSLNVLYDNLRELDARTTQLFLDASFNADRGALILAPNISERRVNIAPIVPVRGLAVYTASTGDQKPLVDHETGLGMFTRFLIGGLAGTADQRPIGNGDRVIDSVELYVHLAANVRLAARKTLGLKQNPTLSRTDNLFLSQLSRSSRR